MIKQKTAKEEWHGCHPKKSQSEPFPGFVLNNFVLIVGYLFRGLSFEQKFACFAYAYANQLKIYLLNTHMQT